MGVLREPGEVLFDALPGLGQVRRRVLDGDREVAEGRGDLRNWERNVADDADRTRLLTLLHKIQQTHTPDLAWVMGEPPSTTT